MHLVAAAVAAVAYNAALMAVKHCHKTAVHLEGSSVGIDIQHVDSRCLTWAFVVAHSLVGDSHGHLTREVLAEEEVVDEVHFDGADVFVPGRWIWSDFVHLTNESVNTGQMTTTYRFFFIGFVIICVRRASSVTCLRLLYSHQ